MGSRSWRASGDGVLCCERIVTGARDSATTSQHAFRVATTGRRQYVGSITSFNTLVGGRDDHRGGMLAR